MHYATVSTSSRWFSISWLLGDIEVAMAVAVADDDVEPGSLLVELFKSCVATSFFVCGLPWSIMAAGSGLLMINDELARLPLCWLLYGAMLSFLASLRSFFCCITSFSWSSLLFVFMFSISNFRFTSIWLHPEHSLVPIATRSNAKQVH